MQNFDVSVSVSAKKVTAVLGAIIAGLILLGGLSLSVKTFTQYENALGIVPLFDLDSENSIPAYFSSFNLAVAAGLLFLIYLHAKAGKSKFQLPWLFLALIFLALSIDETVAIHELFAYLIINKYLSVSGPGQYAWAIMGSITVLVFLVLYGRFIFHLPLKTRIYFFVAGAVYIMGALGMEAVGGYLSVKDSPFYGLEVMVEEGLEMLGIWLFIKALLNYIETYLVTSGGAIFRPMKETLATPKLAVHRTLPVNQEANLGLEEVGQ
ncbi:hypothetical protein ACFSC6_17705 [Rufibacter sediminis]|uniref:Multidrug transporter n=1 Tax=Rufibacter sediminis TaxID=2762756 RepID=A0ABR6VMV9_9BACT|nr:hypothetical protein [Rufibacter sediminis]MBC3538520.1 hypothetical protein [Rufibacter sediminis]